MKRGGYIPCPAPGCRAESTWFLCLNCGAAGCREHQITIRRGEERRRTHGLAVVDRGEEPARRGVQHPRLDGRRSGAVVRMSAAVEAASADMSWKAIDRYSKDYVELQTKDNVKFYKTPDSVLKRQLEIFDEVAKKKAGENPLFKKIVQSQLAFAKRAVQWEQDTVVKDRKSVV